VLVRLPEGALLAGGSHFPEESDAERVAGVGIVESRRGGS